MPFVVIKQGKYFRVKNSNTGKVGSDKFVLKENAEKQRKNRERFIKLIASKTSLKNGEKVNKKK
tara:strand:- start:592 stop:783 length:192 start_codon:yes stop_codon:yes gene_type:complete